MNPHRPKPSPLLTLCSIAALLLSSCTVVDSVSRTAKNVVGIPDEPEPSTESAVAADAIPTSEYAAACLRERRKLLLGILNLKEGSN